MKGCRIISITAPNTFTASGVIAKDNVAPQPALEQAARLVEQQHADEDRPDRQQEGQHDLGRDDEPKRQEQERDRGEATAGPSPASARPATGSRSGWPCRHRRRRRRSILEVSCTPAHDVAVERRALVRQRTDQHLHDLGRAVEQKVEHQASGRPPTR